MQNNEKWRLILKSNVLPSKVNLYDILKRKLNENNFKPPLNRTPFKGSSNFAEKKLDLFIENNIKSYQSKRNRLDLDGTSMISAYINSGILDINHVFNLATNAGDNSGVNSWVNELLWREFNAYIMFHFPDILDSSFKNFKIIHGRRIIYF